MTLVDRSGAPSDARPRAVTMASGLAVALGAFKAIAIPAAFIGLLIGGAGPRPGPLQLTLASVATAVSVAQAVGGASAFRRRAWGRTLAVATSILGGLLGLGQVFNGTTAALVPVALDAVIVTGLVLGRAWFRTA